MSRAEIIRMCKDWADKRGYWVHSHTCFSLVNGKYVESGSAFVHLNLDIPSRLFETKLGTEKDAVIRACQFILNKKD